MTKATGRGRGWRRKTWDALAPSTRARYTRAGINEERHNRGDTPRTVQKWIETQQALYGWEDLGDGEYSMTVNGQEHEDSLPEQRGELLDLIRDQERAQAAYARGDFDTAREIWENRDPDLPEWMYYYHGVFS